VTVWPGIPDDDDLDDIDLPDCPECGEALSFAEMAYAELTVDWTGGDDE